MEKHESDPSLSREAQGLPPEPDAPAPAGDLPEEGPLAPPEGTPAEPPPSNPDKVAEKDADLDAAVHEVLPEALQMARVSGQCILNLAEQLFVKSWECRGGEMTASERKRLIELSVLTARDFKVRGDEELDLLVKTYDRSLRKRYRGKDAPKGESKIILPGSGQLKPFFLPGTMPGVNGPLRGR